MSPSAKIAAGIAALFTALAIILMLAPPVDASGGVPGTPNTGRSASSGSVVILEASADGRTIIIGTEGHLNPKYVRSVTATTTAYDASGKKLWVVDVRNVPHDGMSVGTLNKDRQRMPRGWWLSTTVFWDAIRIGDTRVTVKNTV